MFVDNFIPIIFFTGGIYKARGQVPRNWAAKFGFGRSQEGKHPWREENRQLDTSKKDSSVLVQFFFFASDIFFRSAKTGLMVILLFMCVVSRPIYM